MKDKKERQDKQEKKEKRKKKKIGGKIFLGILCLLLLITICDICITEIYARKLPHHFASAEEGKEILLAETDYYGAFTQNDIEYRMQKEGATLDELMTASADEIKDFSLLDKYLVDRRISKMFRTLKKNGYELPPTGEIIYIKTDMAMENGVCKGATGYTHGNQIYLNSTTIFMSIIPEASQYFDTLMWHELFHCLTRNNPDFRAEMYSLINFTVTGEDFEFPPSVNDKYITNPDVEHHDSYATFTIDGKEIDCYTVWAKQKHFSEVKTDEDAESVTLLVPVDGTDTYYLMDKDSNYQDVFGANTDYTTDPEECMADNFKYAMYYGIDGKDGQGYPNPEIIQGIIDYVSQ